LISIMFSLLHQLLRELWSSLCFSFSVVGGVLLRISWLVQEIARCRIWRLRSRLLITALLLVWSCGHASMLVALRRGICCTNRRSLYFLVSLLSYNVRKVRRHWMLICFLSLRVASSWLISRGKLLSCGTVLIQQIRRLPGWLAFLLLVFQLHVLVGSR